VIRVCTICKEEKLISDCSGTACKLCHAKRRREWRKANPDREKINQRKQDLKRYFGITPEQYDAMLQKQSGKCAGCNRHQTEFVKNLAVDHDHKTGIIRGLLCEDCNIALGKLKDNVSTLNNLINYLENSQSDLAVINPKVVKLRLPKKVG
jgi:hypothetical protein